VTISKDGQIATLSFNEALLKQSVATNQPPQMQMQQPNVQAQPIVPAPVSPQMLQQRPAPIPQLPTPPPRVRGVIPKNPVPNTTPYPPAAPGATPEVEL
jgi:hypothetical protein